MPEEVVRVDVQQPERAAGDVVAEDAVAVRGQRLEELQEEQRHDREVVARQATGRQPDQQPGHRADRDDQRDGDDRREMDPELVRVEEGVEVRADPVEGDVAEIEQAAPPDDDVEPEREQHVEDGLERDEADVAARLERRQQREGRDEQRQPGPPRRAADALLDDGEPAPRVEPALLVARDPLVVPDGRAVVGVCGSRGVESLIAHTFRMSARPSRPCGRKIMKPIRIEKTTRSDHFVEM